MAIMAITTPYITVGLGLRRSFEELLAWAERGGCTVNYRKAPGIIETTYHDIRVEGDEYYVRGVNRWVNDRMGRMV